MFGFNGLPCIDSTVALVEVISQLPIPMFTHSPYIPESNDQRPLDISQIGNLTGVMLTNRVDFRYWDEMRTDGVEDRNSSYYIFYIIVTMSVLALVYIVVLISIVSYGLCKRFPPAVKSEPAMSIFILASSSIWLALAVLLTIDGKFYPFRGNDVACTAYCHLIVWLGAISTSFNLGGVLAKSLKLYSFWVLNKFQKNYK